MQEEGEAALRECRLLEADSEEGLRNYLKHTLFVNDIFLQFMKLENVKQLNEKQIEFPIAVVPMDILDELRSTARETTSRVLVLSEYTIKKQNDKHKEILLDHYSLVQRILDTGTCIRENRSQYAKHHVLVFHRMQDSNDYLKVTLKITADGTLFYLQSVHIVDEQRFWNERSRGKLFRSGHSLRTYPKRRCLDFLDV